MTLGLTIDEFVRLGREPTLLSDQPLTLSDAAEHIRRRGYDCRPQSLSFLVEGSLVERVGLLWTKEKVEECCEYFEEHEFFTPYVEMCRVLGFKYAAFLMALKEAAERETEKYGVHVRADDQLFVLHRVPVSEEHAAVISFSLCDAVRERLERGQVI